MQRRLLYIFIGLLLSGIWLAGSVEAQSFYGTTDLETFRKGRDSEMRDKEKSPLLKADVEKFTGLNYFRKNRKYRVKVNFIKTPDEKYFLMPTSSGRSVKYTKVGVLRFNLKGNRLTLNAYQSEYIRTNKEWNKKYGHAFFIPYKDLTNGKETYGGGRYIYMNIPKDNRAILDFNLTFNPSCAYGNERYSCPLPPRANHLKIKIKAGEKIYSYSKLKK